MQHEPFRLRSYQAAAVTRSMVGRGKSLVIAPTGAGKTVVIAEGAKRGLDAGERTLILTHSSELVQQNTAAVARHVGIEPSVCAGSLGRREVDGPIVVANISTAHRRREQLAEQQFDRVWVDEAHRVNPAGKVYAETLRDLVGDRDVPLVGLTGTPHRLGHGFIAAPGARGEDAIFDEVAFEIAPQQLLSEGHLVPVRGRRAQTKLDVSGVARDAFGDFRVGELAEAVNDASVTDRCVAEMVAYGHTSGRRRWLAFAVSIPHAVSIAATLHRYGVSAAVISAKTPPRQRARDVAAYRAGKIDCLVSVAALAIGFDVPAVDLIGMFRPTHSAALYAQMLGRGSRPFQGKDSCVVMDFAGSYLVHGPPDQIDWRAITQPKAGQMKPAEERGWYCDMCETANSTGTWECAACGEPRPRPEQRDPESVLAGRDVAAEAPCRVTGFDLRTHVSRTGSISVAWQYHVEGYRWPVVNYRITNGQSWQRASFSRDWFEHGGQAPAPTTPQQAVARQGELRRPDAIWVRRKQVEGRTYYNVGGVLHRELLAA